MTQRREEAEEAANRRGRPPHSSRSPKTPASDQGKGEDEKND